MHLDATQTQQIVDAVDWFLRITPFAIIFSFIFSGIFRGK